MHLEVFSEPGNESKLDHAMTSLKKSMKWDEDTFGLEYDLDIYNIVAVNDFNMGAMENKVCCSVHIEILLFACISQCRYIHCAISLKNS